jgi:hypothetical protein
VATDEALRALDLNRSNNPASETAALHEAMTMIRAPTRRLDEYTTLPSLANLKISGRRSWRPFEFRVASAGYLPGKYDPVFMKVVLCPVVLKPV